MNRRSVLRLGSVLTVGSVAGCLGETGEECQRTGYHHWLRETENYAETYLLGQDTVDIAVGAPGNAGNRAFEPSMVVVDIGTVVRWVWTGEGGAHNVVDECGLFESDVHSDADTTFSYSFDTPGVYTYYCSQHTDQWMRGVVRVE